ncbi:unnamed protein product, partial [Ectocarpus sp. 6 AP-2014]
AGVAGEGADVRSTVPREGCLGVHPTGYLCVRAGAGAARGGEAHDASQGHADPHRQRPLLGHQVPVPGCRLRPSDDPHQHGSLRDSAPAISAASRA